MGLESATYTGDLNVANPDGSDRGNSVDDHLRLIKTTLKNTLVGFAGAALVTGTDGGAVNAYTVTPTVPLPSYVSRFSVLFSPTITNTGAATLNISGLGTLNIKRTDGTDVVASELVAGVVYLAVYNGTELRLWSPTKQYIDQLAFGTVLPAQSGNADYLLTTTGAVAGWTASLKAGTIRLVDSTDTTKKLAFSLSGITTGTTRTITLSDTDMTLFTPGSKLLATLSPTAAANCDFLTTFTSTYDNHLIFVDGVRPAADDQLRMQFAVAGTTDGGSKYYTQSVGTNTTSAVTSMTSGQTTSTAGIGISLVIHIANTNDATRGKVVTMYGMCQTDATPTFAPIGRHSMYSATNAVSGVRFSWVSGNNFAPVGSIRVVGINNS